MKINKLLYLFAAVLMLALNSCTKESESIEILPETPEDIMINPLVDNVTTRDDGSIALACFSLPYPVSLDIDGTVHEINDQESFATVTELAENGTVVEFVYPVNIVYEDGSTAVANNSEEFGEYFAECIPDEGWSMGTDSNLVPAFLITDDNFCYELQYPVTVTDLNTTQEVANQEDLITLLSEQDALFFTLPLTLQNEEGDLITLGTPEDFFGYLTDCTNNTVIIDGPLSFSQIACYTLQYPFDALDQDGNTITINNEEEQANMIINGNFNTFVFPITLLDNDGNALEMNSIEDIDAAVEDCPNVDFGGNLSMVLLAFSDDFNGISCYSLNYPIQVTTDELVISVENSEQLNTVMMQNNVTGLELPVSVTMPDGSVVTVSNDEEIMALIEECQG